MLFLGAQVVIVPIEAPFDGFSRFLKTWCHARFHRRNNNPRHERRFCGSHVPGLLRRGLETLGQLLPAGLPTRTRRCRRLYLQHKPNEPTSRPMLIYTGTDSPLANGLIVLIMTFSSTALSLHHTCEPGKDGFEECSTSAPWLWVKYARPRRRLYNTRERSV